MASPRHGVIGSSDVWTMKLDQIIADPTLAGRQSSIETRDITELMESIRIHGQLQPAICRRHADKKEKRAILVFGFGRYAALRKLAELEPEKERGIKVIFPPANINEAQAAMWAFVENLHRTDPSILDKALAVQQLMNVFNYTQTQIARELCRSTKWVQDMVAVAAMPKDLQERVNTNEISVDVAMELVVMPKTARQKVIDRAKASKPERTSKPGPKGKGRMHAEVTKTDMDRVKTADGIPTIPTLAGLKRMLREHKKMWIPAVAILEYLAGELSQDKFLLKFKDAHVQPKKLEFASRLK